MGQVRKSSQKKYDRILKTTIKLFNKKGISISGVDLISAESGVAKMTLYKYFGSKEGLIEKYLEHVATETMKNFIRDCGELPIKECLTRFYDVAVQQLEKSSTRGCPLICAALELGRNKHRCQDIILNCYEDIRQILQVKLENAKHKEARDTSYYALNLYQGSVILSYMENSPEPLLRAKNQALSLL